MSTEVLNPYVMVGTPAYAGMVHIDYVAALTEFHQHKIAFSSMMIGNESLITRARNTILARFAESTRHSHLLFLDGDVHLSGPGLQRMLSHQVDVIAAPVPLKSLNERGERIFNIGHALGEYKELIEVSRVGTAALLRCAG
jgi:hypothetical protein